MMYTLQNDLFVGDETFADTPSRQDIDDERMENESCQPSAGRKEVSSSRISARNDIKLPI